MSVKSFRRRYKRTRTRIAGRGSWLTVTTVMTPRGRRWHYRFRGRMTHV